MPGFAGVEGMLLVRASVTRFGGHLKGFRGAYQD